MKHYQAGLLSLLLFFTSQFAMADKLPLNTTADISVECITNQDHSLSLVMYKNGQTQELVRYSADQAIPESGTVQLLGNNRLVVMIVWNQQNPQTHDYVTYQYQYDADGHLMSLNN